MACCYANCTLNSERDGERMLACWNCDKHAHLKCAGISGRCFDIIQEGNGIRWSCVKCRPIDVEIFKLYREIQKGFKNVGSDLLKLVDKFKYYENLFNSFKTLNECDPLVEPPKTPTIISIDNTSFHTPTTSQAPTLLEIPTQKNNNIKSNTLPKTNKPPKSSTSKNSKSPQHTVTIEKPLIADPKPLITVKPKRAIFVSRFAPSTTEIDIQHYIRSKFNTSVEIVVHKFNYKFARSIISFKIIVPEDVFNQLLNTNFWPENTLVHEYEFKQKTRDVAVRIPKATASKNY